MSSINTNVAAMTALQTLTQTNKQLTETQNRISTGYRVADASDNAAYWSIATTMRSDNAALSTVQDALGLGAATVDVAYTGLNSAIKVVDQIKSKLVAARQPGVDRNKIQSEITELQAQLRGIADSATFSGENWLSVNSGAATYNPTKSIVSSFSRTAGAVVIGTITVDVDGTKLFDAADQSGILDTQSTTTNGGVTYLGRGLHRRGRHLGPDRQRQRPRGPGGDHRRRRRHHLVHDRLGHGDGRGQGAHRHPAGFRQEPYGRHQPRHRPAGRCRHERGVDQAAGPAGQAAARCTGAQHRQHVEPDDPFALPLRRHNQSAAWLRPRPR